MAKIYGSVKRFGARYGKKIRQRLAKVEEEQRKKYECPYCKKLGVQRIAAGIWYCKKCDTKFTSKAYRVEEFQPKSYN